MPNQNPVHPAIVGVSVLGVKLAALTGALLSTLLTAARSSLRSQSELALENLAFVGGLHHRYTRRAA